MLTTVVPSSSASPPQRPPRFGRSSSTHNIPEVESDADTITSTIISVQNSAYGGVGGAGSPKGTASGGFLSRDLTRSDFGTMGRTRSNTLRDGSTTVSLNNNNKNRAGSPSVTGTAGGGEGTIADTHRTIPLVAVLLGQCLVVLASFIVIITVTDVLADKMASDLVSQIARAELNYAATTVDGELSRTADGVLQLRNRFAAHMAFTAGGKEMCDDTAAGLNPSATFFSDASSTIENMKMLSGLWSVNLQKPLETMSLEESSGETTAFSMCLSARNSLGRVDLDGQRWLTTRVPTSEEWGDLSVIPLSPYTALATVHYTTMARGSFLATDVRTEAYLSLVRGQMILFIGVSAPIRFNITDTVTGDLVRPPGYLFYHSDAPQLIANSSNTIVVTSAIGAALTLDALPSVLLSITVPIEDAHTTLYDLNKWSMLASSIVGLQEGFDLANKRLRTAGATGYASLDAAFATADPDSLPNNGDIRVEFTRDEVVATYILSNQYGGRFAFVQSTPRSYYFGPKRTLRSVLIGIGVGSAGLVTIVCVVFAIGIRRTVKAVVENMGIAANMRNDRVLPMHAYVSEMQALMDGFDRMNTKLLNARAYLPQHMLISSDDSHGEEDVDDDEEGGDTARPGYGRKGGDDESDATGGGSNVDNSTKPSTRARTTTTTTTRRTNSSNGFGFRMATIHVAATGAPGGAAGALGPNGMNAAFALKRVTILALNMRNFNSEWSINTPASISKPANQLAEFITAVVAAHKGVIDSFHGDHYVISFNAVKSAADAPQKAARCALEITEGIDGVFSMGIAMSRCAVGQLGTATLKRLSIVGPAYARAVALERLCRGYNGAYNSSSALEIQCLTAANVAHDIHQTFVTQTLGAVYGAPFTKIPANDNLITRPSDRRKNFSKQPTAAGGPANNPLGPDEPPLAAGTFARVASMSGTAATTPAPTNARRPIEGEIISALRAPANSGSHDGGAQQADEWMYELSAVKNIYLTHIEGLNAEVSRFLSAGLCGGGEEVGESKQGVCGEVVGESKQGVVTTVVEVIARPRAASDGQVPSAPSFRNDEHGTTSASSVAVAEASEALRATINRIRAEMSVAVHSNGGNGKALDTSEYHPTTTTNLQQPTATTNADADAAAVGDDDNGSATWRPLLLEMLAHATVLANAPGPTLAESKQIRKRAFVQLV